MSMPAMPLRLAMYARLASSHSRLAYEQRNGQQKIYFGPTSSGWTPCQRLAWDDPGDPLVMGPSESYPLTSKEHHNSDLC